MYLIKNPKESILDSLKVYIRLLLTGVYAYIIYTPILILWLLLVGYSFDISLIIKELTRLPGEDIKNIFNILSIPIVVTATIWKNIVFNNKKLESLFNKDSEFLIGTKRRYGVRK